MALHPRPAVNIISLCTGGYGLDFGVDLAMPSARSICLVEREAFAVSRLVQAMQEGLIPEAAIWSDARTFDGRAWSGLVDGVIGGIPCQPHSLAGRRRGADDPRDLWSTARRIVVQSGAWWVLIENVPGMLSAKGKVAGAERVWRDLQRLGFAVEGGLFSAAEVGASHERERVFILGVANRDRPQWRPIEQVGGAFGDGRIPGWEETPSDPGVCGEDVADSDGERLEGLRPDLAAQGWDDARRSVGLCDRATLVDAIGLGRSAWGCDYRPNVGNEPGATGEYPVVHASRFGRREGRPEPELRRRRGATAIDGGELDDAARGDRLVAAAAGRLEETDHGRSGYGLGNAIGETGGPEAWLSFPETGDGSLGERPAKSGRSGVSLFPPQPGDADGWRDVLARAPQLEPAVRRVADGMAARVDRLRMLGNGVVPLAAAHAFRTLVARLAARGSAGAAFLGDMMEAAE